LVATNVGSVDGKPHAFFANFAGLVPHRNLVPSPESGARIIVPASRKCSLRFLPFLGTVQRIEGQGKGDRLVFELPTFDRGAVVWIADTK
jgi:hypothetical protein